MKEKKKQITKKEKVEKMEVLEQEKQWPLPETNKHKKLCAYLKGRKNNDFNPKAEQIQLLYECYYSEFGCKFNKGCKEEARQAFYELYARMEELFGPKILER